MTDQTTPCRTTRHCADHGFCHRCTPSLNDATQHLVKAISSAGIEYPASGSVYAALAATLRDAVRPTAVQDDPASWPLVPVTIGPADDGAARQATGQADTTAETCRACVECELGTAHTEHCPSPETHNWGCGCLTDKRPAADRRAILAEAASDLCAFGYGEAAAFLHDKIQAPHTCPDGEPCPGHDEPACSNCDGIDPDTCLTHPDRAPVVGQPAAAPDTDARKARAQLFHFAVTRDMAAEEMADRLLNEHRAAVLTEAADWLVAKYGVTNRAAADLRRRAAGEDR